MIAYHGQQAIKDQYIARVEAHRAADELIRGTGWDGTRGCAVGCTLNQYSHAAYETELGIPRILARLEDGIFEALPEDAAMEWPSRFLAGINPGADLSLVGPKFLHWLLVDPQDGVIRFAKTERSKAAIQRVADLYAQKIAGHDVAAKDWRAAAAYATYAATADAATYAAADAATYAAACAATYAAAAADDAAADAATYAAAADAAARSNARKNARLRQADKLIELLSTEVANVQTR